jgi:release factor glutamine methyltransferase
MVGRAINAATQRLEEAGIDSARLDAQVILAHILGVGRSWLFAHHEVVLDAEQAQRSTEFIARRVAYEPVAYLVGQREFYGLELAVNQHVLIPRPETEMLVDAVLDHLAERSPARLTIADVGTGSGAIALAIAANAPDAKIYATDISAEALAVAKRNIDRLDTRSQIQLCHGDLLTALPGCVDVVVANLPYINSTEYERLMPDVRDYEPQLALEGGQTGLDAIVRLFEQLPARLQPDGLVVLEIGYDQGPAVLSLLEQCLPQARALELRQDYQGHDRLVSFRSPLQT